MARRAPCAGTANGKEGGGGGGGGRARGSGGLIRGLLCGCSWPPAPKGGPVFLMAATDRARAPPVPPASFSAHCVPERACAGARARPRERRTGERLAKRRSKAGRRGEARRRAPSGVVAGNIQALHDGRRARTSACLIGSVTSFRSPGMRRPVGAARAVAELPFRHVSWWCRRRVVVRIVAALRLQPPRVKFASITFETKAYALGRRG